MMGRGHAISGALVWETGCAVAEVLGQPVAWQVKAIGGVLCAGWALAPDLDHHSSTLTRAGGPVTWLAAKAVGGLADVVYDHTCTRWDRRPDGDNSHRTLSHTLVWAFGCYIVGAGAGRTGGPWAAAVMVYLGAMLGLFAAFPDSWREFDVYGVEVPSAPVFAVPFGVAAYLLTPDAAWWLGLATGGGCFVHCLGDSLTEYGCPWLWPLPIPDGRDRAGRRRWKTWYPIGLPKIMRFPVGGTVESVITAVMTVLMVGVIVLLWYGPERGWSWLMVQLAKAAAAVVLHADY